MHIIVYLKWLWLGLLLTACAEVAETPPVQMVVSTIQPTSTIASTKPPIATPTVTHTPRPSATPTPTLDFHATQHSAQATAIVQTLVATVQPRIAASYLSPDGQWRAEVIIYDCTQIDDGDLNAYEQLIITRISDKVEQMIEDQLQSCGGLGAYGLGGLFWSPNSRYFYYTSARGGVPDGLYCYWERPMKIVDVTNWKVEWLSPGPLSPDGTLMLIQNDNRLVVWSLDEGEIASVTIAVPAPSIGEMVWSPDGQALAYLLTESECDPFGKSYVVRLDLPDLQQTVLLDSATPGAPVVRSVVWDAPNRLKLFDKNGQIWTLNLVTQVLTQLP